MKRRWFIFFAAVASAAFISADSDAWAASTPPVNDQTIPLIEMENIPLATAIRQLAQRARLNIVLDPRLSSPPFAQMTVSIRWTDVTAREALAALLENYGLVLVESPRAFR